MFGHVTWWQLPNFYCFRIFSLIVIAVMMAIDLIADITIWIECITNNNKKKKHWIFRNDINFFSIVFVFIARLIYAIIWRQWDSVMIWIIFALKKLESSSIWINRFIILLNRFSIDLFFFFFFWFCSNS